MARGTKQIPGQLTFEMCLDTGNYVVQSNSLIGGKQALKLNSAKLIRAAIMQCVYNDKELKSFKITISELSDLLGVPKSNLYRDIDDITNDIIQNPVFIKETTAKKESWIKIPWVSMCHYSSDFGLVIKLNDLLKPYLLNLREHYAQYTLDCILAMKSIYAVRIFELLQEKITMRMIPKDGIDVELSVQEIREACDCTDKFERFSNFKSKVIDMAMSEIERTTLYGIGYDYIKNGRSVVGFKFHVTKKYYTSL